jgi:hypothetical protein
MDKPKPYKMGGEISPDSMIIIQLDDDTEEPFGIAKVTAVHKDKGEYGELDFRWYACTRNNPRGKVQPGWITTHRGKIVGCYYADKPKNDKDEPYLGTHSSTVLTHWEVILHGFNLTQTGHIPKAVLNAIEASGRAELN